MYSGKKTIYPRSGTAFTVKKGQIFRVTDPQSQQVSDLVLFSQDDTLEFISNGKTFDFESSIRLTTGNFIWSNRSRKLVKITADTCGHHDFLLAPCSQKTFDVLYDEDLPNNPSCLGNLAMALEKYGIREDNIPTAFNIFMNVEVGRDGKISVIPPENEPGSFVEFLAYEDLIVGLTACSAPKTNAGKFKPIQYELFD